MSGTEMRGSTLVMAMPAGEQSGGAQALPPGPWTWTDNGPIGRPLGTGFVYLHDATGRKIGTIWGTPSEKVAIANMICEASEQAPIARDDETPTVVLAATMS